MKIGLISDTHIPSMGAEPPSQVVRAFEGVDLILHAGHIEIASCIEWLERIAPVTATTSWLVGMGEALPRVNTIKVVEAENHTIGMCHELILKSLQFDSQYFHVCFRRNFLVVSLLEFLSTLK